MGDMLNEWAPVNNHLRELAREYEERCEAFDVTIGMGGNDRSKWTCGLGGYAASSRNARQVLNEIAEREGVDVSELRKAIFDIERKRS